MAAEHTMRFKVSGMHCSGCSSGVRAELLHTEGVLDAMVDYKSGLAVVRCDRKQVSATQLLKVIEDAGFKGRLITQ
jgi:Cu2+-exporting ATPase